MEVIRSGEEDEWKKILNSSRITKEQIDYVIDYVANNKIIPISIPIESVYNYRIFPPRSIAVSGVGGVIGAILALKNADEVKYFITTEEVMNADEKNPLYLSKYTLDKLQNIYAARVVQIKLNDFNTIKSLLRSGGIYISGLPYEVAVQIAQLAGFGKIWHFSNINKKFYVF